MKYFLAALMSGPAGLQKLPIFLIAAFVFLALGILHSPLWLLGLAGVLGVVASLAAQERFRKVVDSRRFKQSTPTPESEYETLSSQIKIETRSRLKILERKRNRILEQQTEGGTNEFVLDSNRDALQQLLRLFAKLLITRQQLLTEDFSASSEKAQREIEGIQNEISASTSDAQRASLNATLQLQHERLRSLEERSLKVQEIESDLKRIEAHFELALSQASTRERPQGITTDIGLVTQGLHEETLPIPTDSHSERETTTSGQRPIAQ
jgi:hypothetical protein